MAAAPPVLFNPVGAQCTLTASDPCLYQVAGYLDNNPQAQLSGCQSFFGFPIVPTVTLSAEPVYSTDIATSIYNDIVTSTQTLQLTSTETLTSTVTISETETEYTATVVNTLLTTEVATITTRVAAPATTTTPPAKRLRRRRGSRCKPRSSSVVTTPVASASSPVSSTTGPSFPLASACPNEAAYSSACACLELPAVTQSPDPITSIIRETKVITVTSTTFTTAVEVATQTVRAEDDVTTTATATLSTNRQTTTTVATTTTTTVNAPIPTVFEVRTNESPARNLYFGGSGNPYYGLLSELPGLKTPLGLAGPNTQPTNRWSPEWKLYVRLSSQNDDRGTITMITPAQVPSMTLPYLPLICSVDGSLTLNCRATGLVHSYVKLMSCGENLYLTATGHSPTSGCQFVELNVSPVP
ncbi:hypothetical protein V8F20_001344 [Naviculisporaceae sp. PSN 640]